MSSIDRRRRRLQDKNKLKLLRGGKPEDAPDKQRLTGKGGTADFAVGLDTFCSAAASLDANLSAEGILVALLTVAAPLAAQLGCDEHNFAETARSFYRMEADKRAKPPT